MDDAACVRFLQAVLPRLKMRWAGFRKVRGQVCKRIARRLKALELPDVDAYGRYLEAHPQEWALLDEMCRVTISRFYRDRGVFDLLRQDVLPALIRQSVRQAAPCLRCWSAGCASGEEVYTLKIIWRHGLAAPPPCSLHITATDADPYLLERARRGCYPRGTLKELPAPWLAAAFVPPHADDPAAWCIRSDYRQGVDWHMQDIREEMPGSFFHLVLCRNLVFTYFDPALQTDCLRRLAERLVPGGALVVGKHETLPGHAKEFEPWDYRRGIYRKLPDGGDFREEKLRTNM